MWFTELNICFARNYKPEYIRELVQQNNLPRTTLCLHRRIEKHVNPQHNVKKFSVIKITSVRDMEISRVPASKSLGNCEHLYNQMSSESLGEFEKVRKRLPQSHAGGSARFLWQHFIKDRGLYTGHRAVHQTRLFLHRQTRGKPKPCLIYVPHHVKDFSCTLWEKVEEVDRAVRLTHGWEINRRHITPLFRQNETAFVQHAGKICCRPTDRDPPGGVLQRTRSDIWVFLFGGGFSFSLF